MGKGCVIGDARGDALGTLEFSVGDRRSQLGDGVADALQLAGGADTADRDPADGDDDDDENQTDGPSHPAPSCRQPPVTHECIQAQPVPVAELGEGSSGGEPIPLIPGCAIILAI